MQVMSSSLSRRPGRGLPGDGPPLSGGPATLFHSSKQRLHIFVPELIHARLMPHGRLIVFTGYAEVVLNSILSG